MGEEQAERVLSRLREHVESVRKAVNRCQSQDDLFSDDILHKRAKLLDKAKWLLFNHPEICYDEKVPSLVWKYAFYSITSSWLRMQRQWRRMVPDAPGAEPAQQGLHPQFGSFVMQALGWFDMILLGLSSTAHFPLDDPRCAPPVLPTSRPERRVLAMVEAAHLFHTCIGDLHRYAYQELASSALISECASHRRRSIEAYRCALRLSPSSGHVWKQLYLVALPTLGANTPGIGPTTHGHNRRVDDDGSGDVSPGPRIMQLYCLARACTAASASEVAVETLASVVRKLPTPQTLPTMHGATPAEMCLQHFLGVMRTLLDSEVFSGVEECGRAAEPFFQLLNQLLPPLLTQPRAYNATHPDMRPHDDTLQTADLFRMCFLAVYAAYKTKRVPTLEDAAARFCLRLLRELLTFILAFIRKATASTLLLEDSPSRLYGVVRVLCMWLKSEHAQQWVMEHNDDALLKEVWRALCHAVNKLVAAASAMQPIDRELNDAANGYVVVAEDVELIACVALSLPRYKPTPLAPQAPHPPIAVPFQVDAPAPATARLRIAALVHVMRHMAQADKSGILAEDDGLCFITREAAARRERAKKEKLLFKLGSQHQQHQIAEMETEVKRLKATSTLIAVIDAESFARNINKVKKLVRSQQFLLAVPQVTIAGLDRLKSGEDVINRGARTANKLLTKWMEQGADVVLVQRADEPWSAPCNDDDDEEEEENESEGEQEDRRQLQQQRQDQDRLLAFAEEAAEQRNCLREQVTVLTSTDTLAAAATERGFHAEKVGAFVSAVEKAKGAFAT